MTRHDVGSVDEWTDGDGSAIEVDGLMLAVFRIGGEFYAIQNRCPHKGGPLAGGEVDGDARSVYCPWHTWEWSLETGAFAVDGRQRVRTFDVAAEDGRVVVDL